MSSNLALIPVESYSMYHFSVYAKLFYRNKEKLSKTFNNVFQEKVPTKKSLRNFRLGKKINSLLKMKR